MISFENAPRTTAGEFQAPNSPTGLYAELSQQILSSYNGKKHAFGNNDQEEQASRQIVEISSQNSLDDQKNEGVDLE